MDAAILDRLKGVAGLPSPPGVTLRLLELPETDEQSVVEYAETAATDPAIAGALLKFANARAMGRPVPVPTVRDAVMRIGLRAARVVAFSQILVSCESSDAGASVSLGRVWRRALARSIAARRIALVKHAKRAGEASQAAALAEVSLVALWRLDPVGSAKVAQAVEHDPGTLALAERHVLGARAFEVSAELLRWWRMPRRMCAALNLVASGTEDARDDAAQLGAMLRAAEHFALALAEGDQGAARAHRAPPDTLGLSESDWRNLARQINEEWVQRRSILAASIDHARSSADILSRTRQALADLALSTQLENRMMKRRQDELLRRVTTDAVTGIKNRQAFDERLGEEFERAQRSGGPMALLLCDLDHFKDFNDRFGHQAGDLMLRAAAESLAHAARRIDLVARYGGEEFAVIAPQCGHDGARAVAERMRRAVEELSIEWRGEVLRTTLSIGGVVFAGSAPGRSPTELVAAADRLLYAAKEAGRNRTIIETELTAARAAG